MEIRVLAGLGPDERKLLAILVLAEPVAYRLVRPLPSVDEDSQVGAGRQEGSELAVK